MIIEDSLFYWTHRILHHRFLYKRIHKIHHQYKKSIGIASLHAHPIEYILSNIIPTAAGSLFIRPHISTFWIWILWRLGETIDAHSGYDIPWSPYRILPYSTSPKRHEQHHRKTVYNYGSWFTFWDILMGTDL